MSTSNFVSLVTRHSHVLGNETLPIIMTFVMLTSRLKNEILIVQPANHQPDDPPLVLPPAIVSFLSSACNLSNQLTVDFWDSLKETVWKTAICNTSVIEDLFRVHGKDLGFRVYLFSTRWGYDR
jgi:hypothetical protein